MFTTSIHLLVNNKIFHSSFSWNKSPWCISFFFCFIFYS
jgi:hypothetical protein